MWSQVHVPEHIPTIKHPLRTNCKYYENILVQMYDWNKTTTTFLVSHVHSLTLAVQSLSINYYY